MGDSMRLLVEAGYDDQEATTIAEVISTALDDRPLAPPDKLAEAVVTVLMAFNHAVQDVRVVVDGILTAAADCICTFDELYRFIRVVIPITAMLGKSIGSVLEGFVGLTNQNVAPDDAVTQILDGLHDEWLMNGMEDTD